MVNLFLVVLGCPVALFCLLQPLSIALSEHLALLDKLSLICGTDNGGRDDRLPYHMAQARIFQAISIYVHQIKDAWANVRLGTKQGLSWWCALACIQCVRV